jgi:DNA polymerase-4
VKPRVLPTIVHLDADAFFASAEQAADPRLRGKPVAVGGEKRGIIASASYEARQAGVYTPMPTALARRVCPKLIVLPGDFERYEQFSNWMFGYCYDFTPDVEQTSIDEGYFDLSANRQSRWRSPSLFRAIGQKLAPSAKASPPTSWSARWRRSDQAAAFKPRRPAGGGVSPAAPAAPAWGRRPARLNAAGLVARRIAARPWRILSCRSAARRPASAIARGIDSSAHPAREPQKTFGQQETSPISPTRNAPGDLAHGDQLLPACAKAAASALTVKVRYNDMAEDQSAKVSTNPRSRTDVWALRLRPA